MTYSRQTTAMRMARRTIHFSAERSQVYQSYACLSSQLGAENVHMSVRSHTPASKSVFLRVEPVQNQNSTQKLSIRHSSDGSVPIQKTVFDRLSDVTVLQGDVPTVRPGAVNSNRTSRTVVKNKRLTNLVNAECVHENIRHIEDLKMKLARIRQAKEQQQTVSKQLSPMTHAKEQQQTVAKHLSPITQAKEQQHSVPKHLKPMKKFSESEKPSDYWQTRQVENLLTQHQNESKSQACTVTPTEVCLKGALSAEDKTGNVIQMEEDSNEQLIKAKSMKFSKAKMTDDIGLYRTRIHWRAKMEKYHETFREAQKLKLLQECRTGRRQTAHSADNQQPKSDVIRMTTDRRHVSSDVIIYSRKRQAPSIDALVTPAKRARRTG